MLGECEECNSADQDLLTSKVMQFIWKGQNYLTKMNADMEFLDNNRIFKAVMPNFVCKNNPFLLPDGPTMAQLNALLVRGAGDPLKDLCGGREKLSRAKKAAILLKSLTSSRGRANSKNHFSAVFEPFPTSSECYDNNADIFDPSYNQEPNIKPRLYRALRICQLCSQCLESSSLSADLNEPSGAGLPAMITTDSIAENEAISPSVLASYSYRGASMSSIQRRALAPIRDDARFCRVDTGEWLSLGNRGRAVRSYEYKTQIKAVHRELATERRAVHFGLRRLPHLRLIDLSVPNTLGLLTQAKSLQGGSLTRDIDRAMGLLHRRSEMIRGIVCLQAKLRSYRVRLQMKRELLALVERRQYVLLVLCQAKSLASALVDSLINEAVISQARKLSRPIFRFGGNMSGCRVIVSVGLGFIRNRPNEVESWRVNRIHCLYLSRLLHITLLLIQRYLLMILQRRAPL